MTRLVFLTVMALWLRPVVAQSPISYQANFDYGFILLHSQDLAPIGAAYPLSLNFSVQRWLLDEKYWRNCHCFPRLGANIGWQYFDKPEILGWGVPVYGFLEPWYKLSDHWFLNFRTSIGLIYLSNPYDEVSNPFNLSYSLPVQAYLAMGLGAAYQFNEQWRFGLQARFEHTSNGGIREPNKGINYPMLSLGIDYSLQPIVLRKLDQPKFKSTEKLQRLSLQGFLAAKAGAKVGEGAAETDVTYLVSGLTLRYTEQFSRTSAFLLEAGWISNGAYKKQIKQQGADLSHDQIGVEIGHEFLLGKFSFSQAAGYYIFKQFGADSNWYQRYTLLYRPWPNFGFGPGLKAHAQVAEFLEFRLTWDLLL